MPKILGLDLGSTSIGFALIEDTQNKKEIITLGSRIIPLSVDDKNQFAQGNAISKNQDRTTKRTQRKIYDRYQQRKANLSKELNKLDMFPDEKLWKLSSLELYGLRSKGVGEKIELREFGRILLHLNQKRGYKSIGKEEGADKKDTEYVAQVKGRYQTIKDLNLTIGQYFYKNLKEDFDKNKNSNSDKDSFITYRIKDQIFPREAYLQEFEVIWRQQTKHYPNVLTNEFKDIIKDGIIFYQRPLKSQKGLVSVCELEGFYVKREINSKEKIIFVGPKIAPKTSPLFQICKIWETINTLNLKSKTGSDLILNIEQKRQIFEYLNNNEKLSQADLFKILKINKEDYYGNKQIARGLQGNLTKVYIQNILGENHPLLQLNIQIQSTNKEVFLVDRKTGEVLDSNNYKLVDSKIEKEPLFDIWHTMYSLKNEEECKKALIKKFNIEENKAIELARIDLNKQAYGNKSNKAMRKILPYLMEGFVYSEAASFAGYNHSNAFTKDETIAKILKPKLELLTKNSLRQPIVEKILNQLINIVNAIIEKHGKIDEIRIELARELKQSKDERNDSFKYNTQREKENQNIVLRLQEYGIKATRNNIIKWRLFHEISNEESKLNATCVYCGKPFGIIDALKGNEVDVEHIIPKSLLFDDSQSNKTLSHRKCNTEKGGKTAYDYMETKGNTEFEDYTKRVNELFKKKIIGKGKRDKLLTPQSKIPKDFIERQLRETQYIAKKAKEILEDICLNVWSTSGEVTAHLRRLWGWDDVLMNLQFEKYKAVGQTKWVEWETEKGSQKHKKEVIKDWSKRDDHRHHAIDALVIACTKQGFIQRINTLSAEKTRKEILAEIDASNKISNQKANLLDKYLTLQKPFSTSEVEKEADKILISFKAGKKVATLGTRKIKKDGKKVIVQKNIIIPRGALSEESVYGKIKTIQANVPLKTLFENVDLVVNSTIKSLINDRIAKYEGDIKTAFSSTKKDPIFLDNAKEKVLENASMYKSEFVIKYPLGTIDSKKAEKIVDAGLKNIVKERLMEFGGNTKNAFAKPLYLDSNQKIEIKTVRCFTGLSAVEPIITRDLPNNIQFEKYVKPGNNHHIALYKDQDGKLHEHVVSFWHAVERKKYKLPVIISNPAEIWDTINSKKEDYPQTFIEKLPQDRWKLDMTLQQNEMYVLGMTEDDFDNAIKTLNKETLSKNLYRVQKIGASEYWFRHHLETELKDDENSKIALKYYRLKSIGALQNLKPKKIKINILGDLI